MDTMFLDVASEDFGLLDITRAEAGSRLSTSSLTVQHFPSCHPAMANEDDYYTDDLRPRSMSHPAPTTQPFCSLPRTLGMKHPLPGLHPELLEGSNERRWLDTLPAITVIAVTTSTSSCSHWKRAEPDHKSSVKLHGSWQGAAPKASLSSPPLPTPVHSRQHLLPKNFTKVNLLHFSLKNCIWIKT